MALTKTPIELSSTPSIVDGGNATAITIDSSENIGLGVTNPADYYAENLVVAAADEGGITIESATTEKTYLMFADGTSGSAAYRGFIGYDHGASPEIMNIASSGDMNFLTGSSQSEKVRIKEAGQLIVPAGVTLGTGAGVYAAGNTLDDYEEGAFSTVSAGVNASGYGPSMRYTKIGRAVNILARVTWTGTSNSSALRFTLPFATPATAATATGAVFYGGTSLKSGAALSCYVGPSTNEVYFYSTAGGSFNQLNVNEVNGSYDFIFSFTYETNL